MGSDRSEHPHAVIAPWTISRAEWDGYVQRTRRFSWWMSIVLPILAIFAIACMVIPARTLLGLQSPRSGAAVEDNLSIFTPTHIAIAFFALFCAWSSWSFTRQMRRTNRALLRVWDAAGCVCPSCLQECAPIGSDGTAPCCVHTVSRSDQPALVDLWQAVARGDVATSGLITASFLARAPKPSLRARFTLHSARLFARSQDATLSFGVRYRAALFAGVFFQFWMVLVAVFTKNMTMALMTVPAGIAGLPLVLMGIRTTREGHAHCTSCKQLLAKPHPQHCPECGNNLASAGAIKSTQSRSQPGLIVLGIVVCVGTTLLPTVAIHSGGLKLLPTSAVLLLARYSDFPSLSIYPELESRSLSGEEALEFADVLIEDARPSDQPGHVYSDFILKSARAGTVPWSKVDEALGAVVAVRCEVEGEAPATRTLVATAAFGGNVAMSTDKALFVFGGVSFNAAPFVGGVAACVDEWAANPYYRQTSTTQGLPVVPNEFRVAIPNNARTARWRGWVMLSPLGPVPAVAFDDQHVLIAPPSAVRVVEIGGDVSVAN